MANKIDAPNWYRVYKNGTVGENTVKPNPRFTYMRVIHLDDQQSLEQVMMQGTLMPWRICNHGQDRAMSFKFAVECAQ